MDYWRHGQREYLPGMSVGAAEKTLATVSGGRLRVFIRGGTSDHFQSILAVNIRHWGYEAVFWPLPSSHDSQAWQEMEGDILLYDMDASLQPVPVLGGVNSEAATDPGGESVFAEAQRPQAHLLIALSSHSVSRLTLERMGAITLLRKPFDMRHLERYLRVFQQLFYRPTEHLSTCVPDLSMFSKQIDCLLTQEGEVADNAPVVPARHRRILVADDRQEMTGAIRQCLVEQGNRGYYYEVHEVHDGLDLLEQCLSWQPHCVVTDLLMPWLNGYQVMHCLDASLSRPAPAFVVISALTRHEIPGDRSYLRDKAVLYIDKPFEVENLLALIEQALAQ